MALPSGLQAAATRWGVAIGLYATDPAYRLEIERAPDNGSGLPVLSGAEAIAEVSGADSIFVDDLPSDGLRRHYRYRQVREGEMPSEWTCWVSSPPYPLSGTPERPAVVLPVARESVSESGGGRVATLTIEDPQCRVLEVAFDVGAGFLAASQSGGTYSSPSVAPDTRIRARVTGYDASGSVAILVERDFGTEGTGGPDSTHQPGLFARATPHWSRPGEPSHLELRLEYGSPGTRAVFVEFQYREFGQPGGPVDQWSQHAYTLPAGIWRQTLWLEDRHGNVHTWDPLDTPPRITITPYSEPGDRQGTPGTPIEVDAALPASEGGVRVRSEGAGPGEPILQADYLGIGTGLSLSRNPAGYPVVALSGGAGVDWTDGFSTYDLRYRRISDTVPAADIAGKLALTNLPALAILKPAAGGGLSGAAYDGHGTREWSVSWDLGAPTYDQYYADKSHGHPALTPGSGLSGTSYDGLTARSWSVDWNAGRSIYDNHYRAYNDAITWADVSKSGSSLAHLATRAIADTTGTLATSRGGTGSGAPGAAGRILRSSSSSAAAWVAPSLLTAGSGLTGSSYDGGTARTWSVNWAAGAATYDGYYAPISHPHPSLSAGSGLSGSAYDGLTARSWSVDWTAGRTIYDNLYIPKSTGVAWADVDKTGSSLADLTTRAISATTGTLAISRGGTGLATTPGATGRFLRSASSSVAAWSGILAADLPAHTHGLGQLGGSVAGQVLYGSGSVWDTTTGGSTGQVLTRTGASTVGWRDVAVDAGVTGITIASGLGLAATGTGGPRYTGDVGLSVVWADGYSAYDGRYSRTAHTHPYLPLSGGTLTGPLTAGGGQGTVLLHQNGYIDVTRGGHLLRLNANYGNSNTHAHIGTDTALPLRIGTGAQANYAFHIDLDQNVGIGTTTPSSKLHVNGTITAQHATFTGTVTATRFRTS